MFGFFSKKKPAKTAAARPAKTAKTAKTPDAQKTVAAVRPQAVATAKTAAPKPEPAKPEAPISAGNSLERPFERDVAEASTSTDEVIYAPFAIGQKPQQP